MTTQTQPPRPPGRTDAHPLRLGTRRSALALAQSQTVADALVAATGRAVELVEVTTEGDVSRAQLTQIGGTGVFVTALRQALIAGSIDLAVHSLKDLPTAPEPAVVIAAIPPRGDTRDVLVARDGRTLAELAPGTRIGTGAPRRAAQLLALGLGQIPVPVRGNVDTRIAMVQDGTLDGVLLARAGLVRLGRADEATQVLDPVQLLPAPGQGALAVECRADDADLTAALAALDDPDSRAAVTAERSLLAALEAGCMAPVGALAEMVESLGPGGSTVLELSLRAVVATPDGAVLLRRSAVGPGDDPVGLGRRLAGQLLADGAGRLIADLSPTDLSPTDLSSTGHPPQRPSGPFDPDLSAAQPAPERAS